MGEVDPHEWVRLDWQTRAGPGWNEVGPDCRAAEEPDLPAVPVEVEAGADEEEEELLVGVAPEGVVLVAAKEVGWLRAVPAETRWKWVWLWGQQDQG